MMRLRAKIVAPVLAMLLLLTACASTAETPEAAATREGAESNESDASADGGGKGGSGTGRRKEGSKAGSRKESGQFGGSGSAGGSSSGSGSAEGTDGGGSGRAGSRDSSPTRSAASDDGVSSPAAGTYVYGQQGFEEFCSTGCERDRLPPSQKIQTTHRSRTATSRIVVTEARASGDRLVRTTTRYTDSAARVTEVHLEYSYEGLDFSRTYRPKPPVPSLRFPLRSGDGWSGTWRGDVRGSYSVHVDGRDAVGGVNAAKLDTRTRFRGDLKGRAHVTLWVDPRDGTVMRTAGNMTVEMGFGTYRTGFETNLRSQP